MLKAIGSKKILTDIGYFDCISDIIGCDELERLKQITHHVSTTRFQHCINVSYYGYIVCRKFSLDARSAARAGLLHDLFYYNRKEYNSSKSKSQCSHSMLHSLMAAENASKLIDISELERDIIEKHMWPATRRLPKYREGYVIMIVDKYCAVLEYFIPKIRRCTSKISRQRQAADT